MTDHPHRHDGAVDASDEPAPVKVKAHHGLCQGWGECHRWAPDVYPLGADGKIDIERLEVPGELAEAAWRGAAACPEQAITVIGERPASWREFERAPSAPKSATEPNAGS